MQDTLEEDLAIVILYNMTGCSNAETVIGEDAEMDILQEDDPTAMNPSLARQQNLNLVLNKLLFRTSSQLMTVKRNSRNLLVNSYL